MERVSSVEKYFTISNNYPKKEYCDISRKQFFFLFKFYKKKERERIWIDTKKDTLSRCSNIVFKNVKANWHEELRKKGGQKEKRRKSKEKENWRERSII